MYSIWEKKTVTQPLSQQDEEEQLLDELANECKETLDTAKRMQLQIEDSVTLTKGMNQLTEKQTERVKDLKDRTEIEGGKTTCRLF
jgi:hypothetical protein